MITYKHQQNNDCSINALAISTQWGHEVAEQALASAGRKRDGRFYTSTLLGNRVGYTVALANKEFTLTGIVGPWGAVRRLLSHKHSYIIRIDGHVFAFYGGKIHDHSQRRGSTRVLSVWRVDDAQQAERLTSTTADGTAHHKRYIKSIGTLSLDDLLS